MLDHPRVGGYTGGLVSAPIFKGIAEKIYAMSGRFINRTPYAKSVEHQQSAVPDVVGMKTEAARALMAARGYDVEVKGNGAVIRGESPHSGSALPRGSVVTLITSEVPGGVLAGYTVVPDVRGLPMRRAISTLAGQHLETSITGSGIAAGQNPSAGEHVKIGTRVVVRCEPKNLSMVTL
jgi:beta-lactam-binding protein with PASTA domain